MKQSIQIGVLGAGAVVRSYANGLRLVQGARIVAVSGTGSARGRQLAAELGADYFTDYHQVLQTSIDAVIVALPNYLHSEATLACAEAGVPVLVEKPMAVSVAEAEAMIDTCQRRGVRMMVGFTHRYAASVRRAKELIGAGALGDIYMATAWQLAGRAAPLDPWLVDPARSGGGIFTWGGSHDLDALRWLLGAEVVEVRAHVGPYLQQTAVEDSGIVSLVYGNGAQANLMACLYPFPCTHPLPNAGASVGMQFFGSRGMLWLDVNHWLYYSGQRGNQIYRFERDEVWAEEMAAFVDFVRAGHEAPITGADGLAVQRTLAAIYQSSAEKRSVRLDSEDLGL